MTTLHVVDRRSILKMGAGALASTLTVTAVSGCAPRKTDPESTTMPKEDARPAPNTPVPPGNSSRTLLVYFSRAGENYYNGGRTNLIVGNTEVLAGMIRDRTGCDVHRIEAAERYPEGYDATVARNVREQNSNARPGIATPPVDVGEYDTVLLASGIWNVRAPMIMTTFVESHDFAGKTIHPVTTHAMSGLGTTERDYARSCPGAVIAEGFAVRGEEVQNADAAVDTWLRRTGLLKT